MKNNFTLKIKSKGLGFKSGDARVEIFIGRSLLKLIVLLTISLFVGAAGTSLFIL